MLLEILAAPQKSKARPPGGAIENCCGIIGIINAFGPLFGLKRYDIHHKP
jgi:hypothetical protein